MTSTVSAAPEGGVVVVDLLAGQHHIVGRVTATSDASSLQVEYRLTVPDGSCIRETNLHVSTSSSELPQKNGNPIPGKFAYKTQHGCVGSYVYSIPRTWSYGTRLYLAAHAVVDVPGGADVIPAALPLTANAYVTYPYPGAPSYLRSFVFGGGSLDGHHDSWCVDTDRVILPYRIYTVQVYPPTAFPSGLIERAENLDLVNWIIAQRFVGSASLSGLGNYTYGDVQRAIWQLLEDSQSTAGLGAWSEARADELVAAATATGEGFEPGCGDIFGVLLRPTDAAGNTVAQVLLAETTFAELGIPCEPVRGTAWGTGSAFPGKNWATYFEMVV